VGVFSRLGRIIKSNLNSILDAAEDPEKSINQLIVEMRSNQKEAKEQVAQAMVDCKKLQRKLGEAQQAAVKWKEKAKVALKRGDDKLAKEALARAKSEAEMAKEYEKSAEAQKRAVENLKVLKVALKALDKRIEEAKRKKHVLLARKKTAEATQSIGSTVSSINVDTDAFAEFDRLAEKIEDMEVKANIQIEMGADMLEAKFEEEDLRDELDDELDSLKLEMGLIETSHQLTEDAGATKKKRRKKKVVEVYEDDEDEEELLEDEEELAALDDEDEEEVDDMPRSRRKKKSAKKKTSRRRRAAASGGDDEDYEDEDE
jgi:phage shock protein A